MAAIITPSKSVAKRTAPNQTASQRSLLITREAFATAVLGDSNAIWDRLIRAGAVEAFTPPAIGGYWMGQGGIYSGQVREEDGTTYHQILGTVKPPREMNHGDAMKWAASVTIDGHSDFTLPTVRGSSLLFANLRHLFAKVWYWTSETYQGNASYAWVCYFSYGRTDGSRKSFERQAVAVRRFVL